MVLQSDLSGLLLYLRMKVAKQNPPFLGAVAFFMEMFWSIVSKKTWQSWEGGVLRKKLLLSQKQRTKKSRWSVVHLGKTLQKLFRIIKCSSGNGFFLGSFHIVACCHQSRGGAFSLLMLGMCFWNEMSERRVRRQKS